MELSKVFDFGKKIRNDEKTIDLLISGVLGKLRFCPEEPNRIY
jgi:hypothetical protein